MRTSKYEIILMMRKYLNCEAGSTRSEDIIKFVWDWKWVNEY